MKIVVIGGTGVIGTGIVNLLKAEHEVISVGKTRGDYQVDLLNPNSIEKLFKEIGHIDGVISTIGAGNMGSLLGLSPDDFTYAFNSKLIANFNLIKAASNHLKPDSFIIVTSGIASMHPIPNSAPLSVACAALEALVRSAALENTNGIRINAVSPAFVKETMELFGMDSTSGISALDTAGVYKELIDNQSNGIIANVPDYLNK